MRCSEVGTIEDSAAAGSTSAFPTVTSCRLLRKDLKNGLAFSWRAQDVFPSRTSNQSDVWLSELMRQKRRLADRLRP